MKHSGFQAVNFSQKTQRWTNQPKFSLVFSLLQVIAVVLLLLGGPETATAQDTTATILGTITDPAGATVAGANVTVTNTQTNVAVSVQTTDSGAYTVPNLNPGSYSITIKSQGFQSVSLPNLAVSAGDRRRTDVALVVGRANETIEITTVAPVLQ